MTKDTDWIETHFEVVSWINEQLNHEDSLPYKREYEYGRGGLYELAEELTDEFQKEYEGVRWNEVFYYHDTLEEFLNSKNK